MKLWCRLFKRTQQSIDAKQAQLSSCNANYLTKCVNPRTAELQKLQTDYTAALVSESELAEIQANKAFWEKIGKFIGKNADDTQMYYAILRGVVLEVIGLALIAQATANKRIQSHYNAPVILPLTPFKPGIALPNEG